MIEHVDAIENLEDILKVKGLDAILIGPYDLSASMGLTAEFKNSEFIFAVQTIKQKSEDAKIACGIHVVAPSPDDLQQRINDGYRFIAYSIDAVFLSKNIMRPFL